MQLFGKTIPTWIFPIFAAAAGFAVSEVCRRFGGQKLTADAVGVLVGSAIIILLYFFAARTVD